MADFDEALRTEFALLMQKMDENKAKPQEMWDFAVKAGRAFVEDRYGNSTTLEVNLVHCLEISFFAGVSDQLGRFLSKPTGNVLPFTRRGDA